MLQEEKFEIVRLHERFKIATEQSRNYLKHVRGRELMLSIQSSETIAASPNPLSVEAN